MKKKEIIEELPLGGNPFEVPEGYFDKFEDTLRARIQKESRGSTLAGILKPALSLAATFGIIFGIGYGTFRLTGTYKSGDETLQAKSEDMVDYGSIEFIEEDTYLCNQYTDNSEIKTEEIVTYLSDDLSLQDLSYYSELL